MNEEEMARILNSAYASFPNLTLTPHAVVQWSILFHDCDAAKFQAALNQAILQDDAKFFPTPGQVNKILKLIGTRGRLETPQEAWEAAWNGGDLSRRSKSTIRLMCNWDRRGEWLTDHLPFKRKEFIEIYESLEDKEKNIETRTRGLSAGSAKTLKRLGV